MRQPPTTSAVPDPDALLPNRVSGTGSPSSPSAGGNFAESKKPVIAPRPSGGLESISSGRRRSTLPWLLLPLALALSAARYGITRWQPRDDRVRRIVVAVREHSTWSNSAAVGLVALAMLIIMVGAFRRRHRADEVRVRSAAATALHIQVDRLMLHRAKWSHGKLRSARIGYPRGAVLADVSAALAEALEPFSAGAVTAAWVRRADRFVISPKPIVAKRLEERYASVKAVFNSMSHLLVGLTIDQTRTRLAADGAISSVVASYGHTTRDIGDGFRQRVQAVLDAKAPSPTGYWTLHWDPAANKVTIAPAQPLPTLAPYPLAEPKDQMVIPVGITDGAQQIPWEPVRNPHMLVLGPTGNGKTIFINSVLEGVLSRHWMVILEDPKELSFRGYDPVALRANGLREWTGIDLVATTDSDMERGIDRAYREMRDRYALVKTFAVREEDLQPILLVIDEAGELIERLTAYHTSEDKYQDLVAEAVRRGEDPEKVAKPKGTKNPQLQKIWSILRLGRQCRVFVLIATQRPDVSFIPGEARDNMICRVALGKVGVHGLDMAFGTRTIQQRVHEVVVDPVTGLRRREKIKGRATVDMGAGPISIQSFWVPDPAKAITGELSAEDAALVETLHEFVEQNSRRWSPKPILTKEARAAATATVEAEHQRLVASPEYAEMRRLTAQEDAELDREDAEIEEELDEFGDVTPTPAQSLRFGDVAVLEVDGRHTQVTIDEIEPDPYGEDDELQVTYLISGDDDPRAGQMGVTTLSCYESIGVL